MTAAVSLEDVDSLRKTVAIRLVAARRSSGLKQNQISDHLGQKNMTQVSLWESAERLPKLTDLIAMAKLYGVPMDFLCGLTDDPIADKHENNQGFLANLISSSIQQQHNAWLAATTQTVAVAIQSRGQDREDLARIGQLVRTLAGAYARMKELNADFDDDVRGAAKVEAELARLTDMIYQAESRIESERRQQAIIEREVNIANGEFERKSQAATLAAAHQMLLDIAR